MFKMVNRYGNAHKVVKTERERDELLKMGFTEEKETVKEEKPKAKTAKK